MATLSKRATRAQQMMFRAVEGAIRDASNAHPEQAVSARMASSIAKRAVGTLSAAFVETLADIRPSDRQDAHRRHASCHCNVSSSQHVAKGERVTRTIARSLRKAHHD